MRERFGGRDEGQAMVLCALMLLTLLFIVGLAVDAGQLFVAKRTEQEAADAAAFAGAIAIYQGGTHGVSGTCGSTVTNTSSDAYVAAVTDATRNGYTDGVNGASVTVNNPPLSGNYCGDGNHVEVTIVKQVQTSLVPAEAAFNPVRARGVAGAESFNNGFALMALDANCVTGISVAPNQNIHLNGGGIQVNSCAASAMVGFQSSQDLQIVGGSINVVGGVAGDTFPPGIIVNTGVVPVADPFAGYPKPSVSGLPVNPALGYGNTAFQGVYTSTMSGVNLCHGIYILKGGGMAGDIGRDTNPLHLDPSTGLPCDGLSFIFNTMSNYPLSGGTCSQIGVSGNHPITLRPLTLGPYANFQIYQDPACTQDVQIGGNQTLDASGTIYIPNAAIHMNGNPATIDGGQLIAKRLDIQNGNLNINYGSATAAQPLLPRLAE